MNTTNEKKHLWLYVLKLEHGKYYVGITSKTPELRMKDHLNDFLAANWTKDHKPLKILDKKDLGIVSWEEAKLYENKVTRIYMKKYGYNNVRGGDLSGRENYVKRFGWLIDEKSWEVVTVIVFLLLVIVILYWKLYFG